MSNTPPKRPTVGNGKICYLEIPAADIRRSTEFYQAAFGWHIRQDNAGNASFDDGVGEVSGMWVLDRPPADKPGLIVSIMVDSVAQTLDSIVARGGAVVRPIGADAPEITAWFSDPAGNVLGLYQERR